MSNSSLTSMGGSGSSAVPPASGGSSSVFGGSGLPSPSNSGGSTRSPTPLGGPTRSPDSVFGSPGAGSALTGIGPRPAAQPPVFTGSSLGAPIQTTPFSSYGGSQYQVSKTGLAPESSYEQTPTTTGVISPGQGLMGGFETSSNGEL